jgi:predicted kinase
MLIVFAGLPAAGKTAIARELAREIGAVYLRIDSIEQAMLASGVVSLPIDDLGYRVAYAIAEDNLRLGQIVVADSVNPIRATRDAWVEVSIRARVRAIEVEIICSDVQGHRKRVETRTTDIPGLRLPAWEDVVSREYDPWDREHLVLDTALQTVDQNVELLRLAIRCR